MGESCRRLAGERRVGPDYFVGALDLIHTEFGGVKLEDRDRCNTAPQVGSNSVRRGPIDEIRLNQRLPRNNPQAKSNVRRRALRAKPTGVLRHRTLPPKRKVGRFL